MSTKAEQTYARINALVDGGIKKADAFKQLAEEYGQPVTSVRGAYYGHKRVLERDDEPGDSGRSTPRRSRKRETTTQDAVASAVATLRGAIDSIEIELETARERADEARAEYDAMQAAAGGRIDEIRAKIAVLDPENGEPPQSESSTEADATTAASATGTAKTAARKEVRGS